MKLKDKLKNFSLCRILSEQSNEPQNTPEKIKPHLRELAHSFLYGGYISVRDISGEEVYRIFLHTVEYYIHTEQGCKVKLHDPVMYHRNKRSCATDLPYLPVMSINPHDSGYDITFENEKEKYRAAVLIRAYAVVDTKLRQFIQWDKDIQKFTQVLGPTNPVNTQSLYLKILMSGFSLEQDGFHPVWVDAETSGEVTEGKKRKGLERLKVKYEGKYDYIQSADYEWSFSRENGFALEECLK